MSLADQSDKPFGVAVRDLVIALDEERFLTPSRNVNWMEFAHAEIEPRGVKYETFRKALAGERPPHSLLIETVSEALGVSPEFFAEHRLAEARSAFDPKAVGHEAAMANLQIWTQARPTGGEQ